MEHRIDRVKNGFTLIEIMIAVAIVAIMGVAAWQVTTRVMARFNRSRAKTTVVSLGNAITQFQLDTGQYPARLRDLVKRPEDAAIGQKWEGEYVKDDLLQDPWGNQYQYQLTPGQEHPYELFSFGPNGRGSPKVEHISVWN